MITTFTRKTNCKSAITSGHGQIRSVTTFERFLRMCSICAFSSEFAINRNNSSFSCRCCRKRDSEISHHLLAVTSSTPDQGEFQSSLSTWSQLLRCWSLLGRLVDWLCPVIMRIRNVTTIDIGDSFTIKSVLGLKERWIKISLPMQPK